MDLFYHNPEDETATLTALDRIAESVEKEIASLELTDRILLEQKSVLDKRRRHNVDA